MRKRDGGIFCAFVVPLFYSSFLPALLSNLFRELSVLIGRHDLCIKSRSLLTMFADLDASGFGTPLSSEQVICIQGRPYASPELKILAPYPSFPN
ncbi:uncharacterized protein BCR38DRAFT_187261 [Pseudomassariella vexata]|uniref:Uncharacterized protein n=1 Tax=Pseudomassariella vexata TaxID=1141098 RepID=A0A1Y2E052_9PEZI|nr:uncharacterized protein BCR38DRAFT_187261 [Pseudomassariella vexata]ORY64920.1 hypothetical protein BCR38DRAFT_187261 [Pseudomassariella vexata]